MFTHRKIEDLDWYHGRSKRTKTRAAINCPDINPDTTLFVGTAAGGPWEQKPLNEATTTDITDLIYLNKPIDSDSYIPFRRYFKMPVKSKFRTQNDEFELNQISVEITLEIDGGIKTNVFTATTDVNTFFIDFNTVGSYRLSIKTVTNISGAEYCTYPFQWDCTFTLTNCHIHKAQYEVTIIESHYVPDEDNYEPTVKAGGHVGFDPILDDPNILTDASFADITFNVSGDLVLPDGSIISPQGLLDYLQLRGGLFTPAKDMGGTVFPDGNVPELIYTAIAKYKVLKGGTVWKFADFRAIEKTWMTFRIPKHTSHERVQITNVKVLYVPLENHTAETGSVLDLEISIPNLVNETNDEFYCYVPPFGKVDKSVHFHFEITASWTTANGIAINECTKLTTFSAYIEKDPLNLVNLAITGSQISEAGVGKHNGVPLFGPQMEIIKGSYTASVTPMNNKPFRINPITRPAEGFGPIFTGSHDWKVRAPGPTGELTTYYIPFTQIYMGWELTVPLEIPDAMLYFIPPKANNINNVIEMWPKIKWAPSDRTNFNRPGMVGSGYWIPQACPPDNVSHRIPKSNGRLWGDGIPTSGGLETLGYAVNQSYEQFGIYAYADEEFPPGTLEGCQMQFGKVAQYGAQYPDAYMIETKPPSADNPLGIYPSEGLIELQPTVTTTSTNSATRILAVSTTVHPNIDVQWDIDAPKVQTNTMIRNFGTYYIPYNPDFSGTWHLQMNSASLNRSWTTAFKMFYPSITLKSGGIEGNSMGDDITTTHNTLTEFISIPGTYSVKDFRPGETLDIRASEPWCTIVQGIDTYQLQCVLPAKGIHNLEVSFGLMKPTTTGQAYVPTNYVKHLATISWENDLARLQKTNNLPLYFTPTNTRGQGDWYDGNVNYYTDMLFNRLVITRGLNDEEEQSFFIPCYQQTNVQGSPRIVMTTVMPWLTGTITNSTTGETTPLVNQLVNGTTSMTVTMSFIRSLPAAFSLQKVTLMLSRTPPQNTVTVQQFWGNYPPLTAVTSKLMVDWFVGDVAGDLANKTNNAWFYQSTAGNDIMGTYRAPSGAEAVFSFPKNTNYKRSTICLYYQGSVTLRKTGLPDRILIQTVDVGQVKYATHVIPANYITDGPDNFQVTLIKTSGGLGKVLRAHILYSKFQ